MSLYKNLQYLLKEELLIKKEDPHAYAKLASTGFILAHPVKIKGQEKRNDNNIPYHATIKFFDKEGDDTQKAHEAASKLDHQHIDPKKVGISTKILKDRNGNDVYSVGLHGHHADKLKEQHNKLSHLGHKENYEWGAHISVPKAVHDEIKASGHKTAHDAGIEFGQAELKRGPKTLHRYGPKQEKLAASEELQKGAVKNALTGVAMSAALAAPSATDANQSKIPARPSPSIHQPKNNYSSDKMLNAISQVESSGGKNTKHKPTSQGRAYGQWALMPSVIHDTIRLNPDLKQHKKALRLEGDNLSHYMQDNPQLEHTIAQKHLSRLEHHFGQNPEALAFSWNQGVTGTNKALKQKQNIGQHPYVQKFKAAYKGSK